MPTRFLLVSTLTAALAFSPVPAAGQHAADQSNPHFRASEYAGERDGRLSIRRCGEPRRHDKHRRTRSACGDRGDLVYLDSGWALYNNRTFEPDSYNDWWHDRPDRALPRWVQEQGARGTCDPDRMWWSGAGWRC